MNILELYIQLGQIIEIFFSFNKQLINEVINNVSYFSDFISIILFLLKQKISFKNMNKRLFYLRLENFKRVQSNKSIDE
jgi:sorbitol-specific phosphotransferase system component IIBC